MQLSVTDLINFHRCPRLLFLNYHGDKQFQLPPTDFLRKLWKVGRDYEKKIVEYFEYKRPKYKIGDYEKGYSETLSLMKEGVEAIYQGVLKNDEIVGIPDFLIKAEGYSKLGNYYYYPVDIKSATTTKERYLFQLASYSYLLGETQDFTPFYGGLLLLDVDMQIRHFPAVMKQVVYAIEKGSDILKNTEEMPDLFIDSNCQMCQWSNFCLPEASEKKDLSLIPNINKSLKSKLQAISIKDYSDFAKCTVDDFKDIEELQGEKGETAILQSKALNDQKIYLKSLPEIEVSEKHIFFDFESDMVISELGTELLRIDYLVGLLKYDGIDYKYSSLLLEENNEEKFVSDFSEFLNNHIDYTFYHYGHYEQSIFENKWQNLPKVNLVNIEKILRNSVIMPVTSYSLKKIAKALGFYWKNKDANAMQSMCWYANYLETKERKYIDLSIQYNEDDCLALKTVKDWLVNLRIKSVPTEQFIPIEEVL